MSGQSAASLSYNEAVHRIVQAVDATEIEQVSVRQSLGLTLAENILVPRHMPDLPRSAVDGFAVQSNMGPDFEVVSEVRAGILPDCVLQPGQAAAIMTGAVVPEGADCVVMIEDCHLKDQQLTVGVPLKFGDLINPAGDEMQAGTVFAPRGNVISSVVYPALFCAGLAEVPVHRQPKVALLVSGDEVREVEDGPAPGQVFNTNRYIIEAICAQLGVPVVATETIKDDLSATRDLLNQLDNQCDIIITSGGVSKGRYDHLGTVLRSDDFDLIVPGTTIKPGRPLHVARSQKGTLVFGMPGYPSALLTNAFLYLIPALKKAAGRRNYSTRWFTAQLAESMRYRPGKTYFNRVGFSHTPEGIVAHGPGSQMSSHFLNFAQCDGLVRMPENEPDGYTGGALSLPVGSSVAALDFGWELT
ncbi:MAG: molybdopterin molybdotransferase MoeA [bacterium]|nr:molybdopterin molybdotransferase MoeA [bacterium]